MGTLFNLLVHVHVTVHADKKIHGFYKHMP